MVDNNILSPKSLEVCQNIQDVCHNCSNLKQAKDELETTTVYTPHEKDDKKNCSEEENSVTIEEIAEMLQQLDDHGARTVDPKKHSLNIIGERDIK